MFFRHDTFGVRKFKSLLVAGSFTILASYIVRLSDTVISGNLIGAEALAGVNLAAPILSASSFLAGLIATGMATQYSLAMGRLDKVRARQFFMQAIWTSLIFGGALSLAVFFGRGAYLAYLGADAGTTAAASSYMGLVAFMPLVECLTNCLVSLGYADGDARLCTISYVVIFVANVLVSVGAVLAGMGTAGCALGSVVSGCLGILVLCGHFLRKTNSFSPVRHFSLRDSVRIAASSFGDAAAFLCDALLFFFLNKYVIRNFGSEMLPVVGVATALWGFLEFFNGIGVAVQPIVTVYYGEGNTRAIRTVMGSAMRVCLVEGVALALFFGLFPEAVVRTVGLTDPALVASACTAVRFMCGGFVALAFAGLYNSYYMFVEKSLLAGVVTFSCYLLLPVTCVALCSLVGVQGVWAGLGLGPFAGLVLTSLYILAIEGRACYPLLLPPERPGRLHGFDLTLDDWSIVETSRKVAGVLAEAGMDETVCCRASLMTEEVLMVVKERNAAKRVLSEVTVDFGAATPATDVTLTIRDDGEIFDITDADAQISSLRTFLVASVMERQASRLNLVTTGFNRNVFRFRQLHATPDSSRALTAL